jgi:hypothetical protein
VRRIGRIGKFYALCIGDHPVVRLYRQWWQLSTRPQELPSPFSLSSGKEDVIDVLAGAQETRLQLGGTHPKGLTPAQKKQAGNVFAGLRFSL